MYLTFRVQR